MQITRHMLQNAASYKREMYFYYIGMLSCSPLWHYISEMIRMLDLGAAGNAF